MEMRICEKTTIRELLGWSALGEYRKYLWTFITEDHLNRTLGSYGYQTCGLEPCLKRLPELAGKGLDHMIPVYSRQEIYRRHDLQEAGLLFVPALPAAGRDSREVPYVVIIPGGGFAREWSLIEGLCIAQRCSELGYASFILFYRTAQSGVVSLALRDVKQCLSWIQSHAGNFGLSSRYFLGGFSAGGTLAALLISDNLGLACESRILSPERVFLTYPAVSFDTMYDFFEHGDPKDPGWADTEIFLHRLAGSCITKKVCFEYSPVLHLSGNCPQLYITANMDDPVVPFKDNALRLSRAAEHAGIPVTCRFGQKGGHSFGLGNGLETDGWLDAFLHGGNGKC